MDIGHFLYWNGALNLFKKNRFFLYYISANL